MADVLTSEPRRVPAVAAGKPWTPQPSIQYKDNSSAVYTSAATLRN